MFQSYRQFKTVPLILSESIVLVFQVFFNQENEPKRHFDPVRNKTVKLFYFLLPISTESIVFGSNFRNGDFDEFARYEVF